MRKRLAIFIALLGFAGTLIGLYADLSGILDEEEATDSDRPPAADVIIQQFVAELTPSNRELRARVEVFNQGDVAAIDGTVTVAVQVQGSNDTLRQNQTFQTIIAGSSNSLEFTFDISGYASGTVFTAQATVQTEEGTVSSVSQTLTKR